MAIVHSDEHHRTNRVTVWDRVQYHVIVTIIFTFCIASAVTKRAAAAITHSDTQQERQSIIAEAKSVAHTAAGYAFKR